MYNMVRKSPYPATWKILYIIFKASSFYSIRDEGEVPGPMCTAHLVSSLGVLGLVIIMSFDSSGYTEGTVSL